MNRSRLRPWLLSTALLALLGVGFLELFGAAPGSGGGVVCGVVGRWEVTDGGGGRVSPMGRVFVDGGGVGSVEVGVAARKVSRAAVFYVDDDALPGGDGSSWGSAFDDVDVALVAIGAGPATRVTLEVAAGTYTWGDVGVPGFDLNVIGAGVGRTVVQHAAGNEFAAQVRGRDVYVEGVSFVGGGGFALELRNMSSVTVVDSEFVGAAGGGLGVYNASSVVVVSSVAHRNGGDGFAYRNPAGGSMDVLEVGVTGSDNGLDGSWTSRGSTVDDAVDIVRVGGVYARNPTNISDVGSGTAWNVDVTTAGALANDQGGEYLNLNVSGSMTGWVIGGDHGEGRWPTVVHAHRSGVIRHVSRFDTLSEAIVTGNPAIVDDSTLQQPAPCS